MEANEIVKLQKKYTADSTAKTTHSLPPGSSELSMSFYFKVAYDNSFAHMTVISIKDQNDL